MAGPNLTPQERDLLVRLVVGEAAGEGPVGQRAVAHVVANRMAQSGQGLQDVVFARNQFEPMGNAATRMRLMAMPTTAPQYQRVAAALQPFFAGESQDPTGGATHFYAPTAQAQLGRRPPSWDNGSGQDIGRHRFFSLGYSGVGRANPHGTLAQAPMNRQRMMAQAVGGRTPGVDSETNRSLGGTEPAPAQPGTPIPPEPQRMNTAQWEQSVNNMQPFSTNPALDFQLRQQVIGQGYMPGRSDLRSPNEPPASAGLFGLGQQQQNAGWGYPPGQVSSSPLPPVTPPQTIPDFWRYAQQMNLSGA